MKRIKLLSLIVVSFLTVSLSSCGEDDPTSGLKNDTRFNMISSVEDLVFVGSLDFATLIEKSNFENHADLPFEIAAAFKMMVKDKIDPEVTGLVLSGDNHFAMSMVDEKGPKYVMFTGKVADQEKVKASLKKINLIKGKYSKEEIDGREYEFLGDKEVSICWDADEFVLVASEKEDCKAIAEKLMLARYKDASENKSLADYLKQKDDMNVYFDIESVVNMAKNSKEGDKITDEVIELTKGSYYIGKGNFLNGEIAFEVDLFGSVIQNPEYNVFNDQGNSKELLKYLSNDKLIGFGLASLNMDVIFNSLEKAETDVYNLEKISEEIGISVEEMSQIFTGDFGLSFVDIIQEKISYASEEDMQDDFFDEDEYSYTREMPVVIFAAGINDSTTVGNLLRENGKGALKINNGIYAVDKEAFIAFEKNKMIVSTDEAVLASVMTGGGYSNANVKEMPMYGFLNTDVTTLPNGVLKMAETEEGQMVLEVVNLFEKVDMSGSINHYEFKAVLKDDSKNALNVITDFIIEIVQEKQLL